ncbi:amidohydrolase family protein [Microbacterium sp. MAHUQ-60]|uniref:amidohydrolase family protein n=1 Tax=unclassified Microbacterium TaxID=2609290 RepID=UPI00361E0BB1
MIIDVHCHVWPDHIAPLVLSGRPAGLDPVGDGTIDGLLRTMDAAGIDYGCTLAIANEPRHVARTNEFAGGVDRARFIPFGTVHTGLSIEENLRHLDDNGIRAVKFHPNFQGMSLGATETLELFEALAERGIVVLAHVGVGSDAAASERGATAHLEAIFAQAPSLRFIACHFGGYHDLAAVQGTAVGSSAYLETSWPPSVSSLGAEAARDLIRAHGADRVVFGSDWPMAEPAAEIAFLRSIGLTAEEESAVLGGNLAGLLGM